jgi:hypothetical protein
MDMKIDNRRCAVHRSSPAIVKTEWPSLKRSSEILLKLPISHRRGQYHRLE